MAKNPAAQNSAGSFLRRSNRRRHDARAQQQSGPRRGIARPAHRHLVVRVVEAQRPRNRQQPQVMPEHFDCGQPRGHPAGAAQGIIEERLVRPRGSAQHRLPRQQHDDQTQHHRAVSRQAPPQPLPAARREGHVPQRHHADQHRRALFRKQARQRHREDGRRVEQHRTLALRQPGIKQQPAQHRRRGQQVGASGHVGHRFGARRVHRPQRRREKCRRRAAQHPARQFEHQQHVAARAAGSSPRDTRCRSGRSRGRRS